jgi:hypothetical protein
MKALVTAVGLVLLLSLNCRQGLAQAKPQYELGGHLFVQGNQDIGYGFGGGGRFTYYVKDFLAVDSEFHSFWADNGDTYAHQGQFGALVGKRTKHVGVFAKARPGYSTFFVVNNDSRAKPRFIFDVGGVLEGYPTKHLVLRLDVGDHDAVGGDRIFTGRFSAGRRGP